MLGCMLGSVLGFMLGFVLGVMLCLHCKGASSALCNLCSLSHDRYKQKQRVKKDGVHFDFGESKPQKAVAKKTVASAGPVDLGAISAESDGAVVVGFPCSGIRLHVRFHNWMIGSCWLLCWVLY